MSITKYHQESFHCYFLKEQQHLILPQFWAMQSQVLGHTSMVSFGSHLRECVFSQIRYWLIIPTNFMLPLHQHTLQTELQHCRPKGLWTEWCVQLSCGSLQSSLYQRYWHGTVKALCQQQPYFSVFIELCMHCSKQCGLALGQSRLQSWQQPTLLGDSHRTLLANNSIRCNPVLVPEASSDDKRWLVGL